MVVVLDFIKRYIFLILAVVIAVSGYFYIRAVGSEYTYVRNDCNSSMNITDVRIDNDSVGKIEITDWALTDKNLTVRMKSVAPGKAYLTIVCDNNPSLGVLYVHKNGVITNYYFFGDCTGCNAVLLWVAIYLVAILFYLIVRYILLEKKNYYNYDNVLYLGLIIFAVFFISAVFVGMYYKNGINGAFQQMMYASRNFVNFTFPLVLVTTICVTISNIKLMRKEGVTWKNMLGTILGLALGIGAFLP